MKNIMMGILVFCSAMAEANETWTITQIHKFGIKDSLFRSQGLATDGHGKTWFSSQVSLSETESDWGSNKWFTFMYYPSPLSSLGPNHVGNIDYAFGKLFLPLEDGNKYKHPVIAIFNPDTRVIEKYSELSHDLQPDGVPWVAVDVASRLVMTSKYSGVTQINLFDMNTFALVGQIQMSQKLTSIQGGKVHDGSLYMTANSPDGVSPKQFSIYKMELSTGFITEVARFNTDVTEVEGLAFYPSNSGDEIHAIAITGTKLKRRGQVCVFKQTTF